MAEYKTIEEVINIIREEVYHEMKARLDESLSSKLYHFCSLDAAVNIMKEGRFRLSHVDRNGSERDIATKIASREKAVYPYSKVVKSENELPPEEKDGTIYKVKAPSNYQPGACFLFKNGKWQYIPNSENNAKHISGLRTGKVTQTELPDGRISYANDSKILYGQYYMCFSRVPGAFDGYSGRMSLNKWKGAYVRFSVNGDLLNTKYKGGPVNFYTNSDRIANLKDLPINKAVKGKSSFVKQKSPTTTAYGEKFANDIDRIKVYEHEDRVYSNDQFIPSKSIKRNGEIVPNPQNLFSSGIVDRIDIFVNKSILEKSDEDSEFIINQVGNILKRAKQYGILKKTKIYDTEAGLSLLPIQQVYDSLNPYYKKKFYNAFKDYMGVSVNSFLDQNKDIINKKFKQQYSPSDISLIANVIEFVCFGHTNNDDKYLTMAKKLIRGYGFSDIEDQIIDAIKPLDYYREQVKKDSYFSMQFRIIKSSINQLQGWKIPKIAQKLLTILNDYAINKMKLPKLGSIVSFKMKQWKNFINGGEYSPTNKFEKKALELCIEVLEHNRDDVLNKLKTEINALCEENGINLKSAIRNITKNWRKIIIDFFNDLVEGEDRSSGGVTNKFFKDLIEEPYWDDYVVEDNICREAFLFSIERIL